MTPSRPDGDPPAERPASHKLGSQPVWLRYAAYPYQKFGMHAGRIVAVSRTPVSAEDLTEDRIAAGHLIARSAEPVYRIEVDLAEQAITANGQSLFLKPGMTLQADVVQDRRTVWEWVFDPLIAATASVLGPVAPSRIER